MADYDNRVLRGQASTAGAIDDVGARQCGEGRRGAGGSVAADLLVSRVDDVDVTACLVHGEGG